MKHTFANIIIDISHEKVDRTFQYIIPEQLKSLVRAGVQVEREILSAGGLWWR